MADDRPVIKQDIDDLKKYMDEQFRNQARARGDMYKTLGRMERTDVAQGKDIENLQNRLNNFFKALTAIGVGVAVALCKLAIDFLKT